MNNINCISYSCNNCGAPLSQNNYIIKCSFCGTHHRLENNILKSDIKTKNIIPLLSKEKWIMYAGLSIVPILIHRHKLKK